MDIKDLQRQGYSIRKIARLTGHSRNTIAAKLAQAAPVPFHRPARRSLLDPYKPYLKERFELCGLSAVRLLEEIRPMGYAGSVDVLRRFLSGLRPARLAAQKATVRFETPPGQQAQADWAYCGRFEDAGGRMVPIYAFTFVLGFSRMLFVRFTTSMDLPTLIECHKAAFEYLGGWPREILYDNMKQVRLSPTEWNPLLLDFANHYGISPITHRVRRPRTKGKVERMVFFVKDNFLNGRAFADIDDLNAQALGWLEGTANARIHATTGRRPCDLLAAEQLTPLAAIVPYVLVPTRRARVSAESYVRFDGSRYSVPPAHVGQMVSVMLRDRRVQVKAGDLIIAEHPCAEAPGSCVAQADHLAQLWKLSLAHSRRPAPQWHLGFSQEVAATPLSIYEAAARVLQPDYEAAARVLRPDYEAAARVLRPDYEAAARVLQPDYDAAATAPAQVGLEHPAAALQVGLEHPAAALQEVTP